MHMIWFICQQRVSALVEPSSSISRDITGHVLLNGFSTAIAAMLAANPMILLELTCDSNSMQECSPSLAHDTKSPSNWQALQQDAEMTIFRMRAICKGSTLPAAGAQAIKVTLKGFLPIASGMSWSIQKRAAGILSMLLLADYVASGQHPCSIRVLYPNYRWTKDTRI